MALFTYFRHWYTVRNILRQLQCKKGSPYSITERRVLELISVLSSQPAGVVSHKPGGRLPLLSARPALTLATLKRPATILLLGEEAQWLPNHPSCSVTYCIVYKRCAAKWRPFYCFVTFWRVFLRNLMKVNVRVWRWVGSGRVRKIILRRLRVVIVMSDIRRVLNDTR